MLNKAPLSSQSKGLGDTVHGLLTRTPAQKRLYNTYMTLSQELEQSKIPKSILKAHGISVQLITRACKSGLWTTCRIPLHLSPQTHTSELPAPTEEEKNLLDAIHKTKYQGRHVAYLELATYAQRKSTYLALAKAALRDHKRVLFIVPNNEALQLWHQTLTPLLQGNIDLFPTQVKTEVKRQYWFELQQKKSFFLLATPAILLYPFPQLDQIIITEEGSADYKREITPRYHARDVAIVCAQHYHH